MSVVDHICQQFSRKVAAIVWCLSRQCLTTTKLNRNQVVRQSEVSLPAIAPLVSGSSVEFGLPQLTVSKSIDERLLSCVSKQKEVFPDREYKSTIMQCDDIEVVLKIAQKQADSSLSAGNYVSVYVKNLATAVNVITEKLKTNRPRMLLMYQQMPMTGTNIIQQLLEKDSELVKGIIVIGFSSNDCHREFLNAGAHDSFIKGPATIQFIFDTLNTVL